MDTIEIKVLITRTKGATRKQFAGKYDNLADAVARLKSVTAEIESQGWKQISEADALKLYDRADRLWEIGSIVSPIKCIYFAQNDMRGIIKTVVVGYCLNVDTY